MAAVVAPHHNTIWQQRRPDQAMHIPSLSMPGLLPPFDATSRAPTAPPAQRAYPPATVDLAMPMFQSHGFNGQLPFQHPQQYGYENHAQAEYSMQPTYDMHPPTQIHHPSAGYQPANTVITNLPHVRDARNAFPPVNRSPSVKTENPSPATATSVSSAANFPDSAIADSTIRQQGSPVKTETGASFSTDVDTLMRMIQAKGGSEADEEPQQRPAVAHVPAVSALAANSPTQSPAPKVEGQSRSGKSRKRYQCTIPNCNKYFYQKTHLEIHTRAHTGIKPFLCHEPSCGQRFSQLGNLKTHERRHTGERPYKCDICAKTFAQRGNVRAHKIVHQQIKPFTCRLDECGKQFTQLGNLKSHQNKFHAPTLRYLTQKFTNVHPGDHISPQDQEIWEYFADLYKNSNKGIKGRGKDRRISTVSSSAVSSSISSASSSSSSAASMQYSQKNGSVSSTVTSATTATGISNEARSISSRASSFVSSPEMYQHHHQQRQQQQPLHPHHHHQQHQSQQDQQQAQQQQHHQQIHHHQPQYQQHSHPAQHPQMHQQSQQRHQSLPQLLNHQQQQPRYSSEQSLQQQQQRYQHAHPHPQQQQQQQQQAQHHTYHQRKAHEGSTYDFHQPVQPVEMVGANGEYHAHAAAAAAASHGYGNLVFPERKLY